ncbi:MAG: glycosyltransferase family 2 protein [Fibrobacter sp.]|nr:glycosyltransferase family 2 protein [Fibrobacter sp.]
MATVSIIVPIYNVETELRKCVSSILAQTYKDIEIILVDDGSPDNCGVICDEYARKDNRIVVIHKENGGLVNARKSGLEKSTGQFISYVDGDDWIEEDFIQELVDCQQKYNVDIVAAGFSKDIGDISDEHANVIPSGFYDKHRMITEIYPRMICAGEYFYFGICSYVWNKLFKKELLYDCQMAVDPRISVGEDSCVVFPVLLKSNSLYISESANYHYYQKAFSMLKSMDSLEKEKEKISWLNDYLLNSLKDAPAEYKLTGQIERYIDSLRIIRYGESKDPSQNRFFNMAPTTRVAIFNSGIVGQNIYSIYLAKKIAPITGWFDKDAKFYQAHGLNVKYFDEIPNTEFDKIIIANLDKKSILSALKILENLGIDPQKIVSLL